MADPERDSLFDDSLPPCGDFPAGMFEARENGNTTGEAEGTDEGRGTPSGASPVREVAGFGSTEGSDNAGLGGELEPGLLPSVGTEPGGTGGGGNSGDSGAVRASEVGPNLFGSDLFGDPVVPPSRGRMADNFIVPPFTVLNAREGWWQARKRAWLRYGIKSEVGRGQNALGLSAECEDKRKGRGNYGKPAASEGFICGGPGTLGEQLKAWRSEKAIPGGGTGKNSAYMFRTADGYEASNSAQEEGSGTSIFDPVLCELVYRWFTPQGGQVLDPFAGGSVRGVVAAMLGRKYWGCDLRPEQTEANRAQSAAICPENAPHWHTGCALAEIPEHAPQADFLFSCPPYGDLEKYSNDPRDLSAMPHAAFGAAYRAIIAAGCAKLHRHRFACFVVGDYRDKAGHYRNFVSETISAFLAAGLHLYNELILVTMVGSLPVRVGKQFASGRKVGKTHQNVLVFVKGDWREAARACEGDSRSIPEDRP